jgi:hypothetical protein
MMTLSMLHLTLHRPAPAPALATSTELKCGSCGQIRPSTDMVDDICSACADDAEDADALVPSVPERATPADVERFLRQLATDLSGELPFTPFAFGTISRKALALLAIVHPTLDILTLSCELDDTIAHTEENAAELGAFIVIQLEAPTLKPQAPHAGPQLLRAARVAG